MPSNPTAPPLVNLCALWGAFLLLCSVEARAADEPPPLPRFMRLEYVRPAGKSCPDQEALEAEVSVHAHRNPFNMDAAALLRVTIERRGLRYGATIELRDGDGRVVWPRKWDPVRSCESLILDLGLLIGDMLRDSPQWAASAPPKPEPAPSAPPLPPPPPAVPTKAEAPPRLPADPLRLELGIAGALAIRTAAPVFSFNLVGDVGLRWPSFSTELEFRWTPPEVANRDDTGRAWISVTQISEGIVLCGHVRARVNLFYCGMGQVMEALGKGSPGLILPPTPLAVAIGGRLGAILPLPWWRQRSAVRVSADALGTLHNATFHVPGQPAPMWTWPGLAVAVGAGFLMDLGFNRALY